jgi:hypothetical protein
VATLCEEVREIILGGKRGIEQEKKRRSGFCRSKAGEVIVRCRVGQKEPWEMGNLVRRAAVGLQCAFEAAVKPFDEQVGLCMKGDGLNGRNAKEGVKIVPHIGNKLRTMVGCDGVGNAKTGNPGCTEGFCTGGYGGRGEGSGLNPVGGAVNYGEDVGVTLGRREWTHQVIVNVGKIMGRYRNRKRNGRWGNVGMSL